MKSEGLAQRKCPICPSTMTRLFSAKVLSKYEVDYFRCTECGLIQTEQPYWLDEAYDSAITDLDVGLVQRNLELSEKVSRIIDRYFDTRAKFLDFAGGYGLFVRLMRDKGFNFFHHDAFCQNLFANFFSLSDLEDTSREFELVSAFEFFEHVHEPIVHFEQMLKYSDTILFTTELTPKYVSSVEEWWYFVPETGQHITFYSLRSLTHLAKKMNVSFYSDGARLHAFTKKTTSIDLYTMAPASKDSLGSWFLSSFRAKPEVERNQMVSTQHDYQHIKKIIRG